MKKTLAALSAFFLLINFSWAQLVINEVSQGTGNQEYVELLVVGTPNCTSETVDLRGWIVDDNNAVFNPTAVTTGTGIAMGCIRFKSVTFWQDIKIGTLIVIYNDGDKNPEIGADDLSTTNGNCVLIIPGDNNTLLERHTTKPDQSSQTYPTSGFVNTSGWSVNSMQGSSDSFQTRKSGNLTVPHHAVSWGNNSFNNIIYFSGSASAKVFSMENTISNDIFDQSNWVSLPTSLTSNQTPGAPNNAANAAWINSLTNNCSSFNGGLNSVSISSNPLPPFCSGQNIILTAVTTPSASAAATYTWKQNGVAIGTNVSTLSITASNTATTYTVNAIDACGSAVATFTSIVGGSGGDATFLPASQTFCESEGIINLVPNNTGGTFTINPPTSALDATAKTFNPALADKNVFYTITYSTSGSCGDTKSNIYSVSLGKSAKILVSKLGPYCKGETIILSSSVTNGNTWSTGETTNTIQVTTTNTYSLSVSGCNNSTTSDNVGILFSSIKADFEPSIKEGNAPLEVIFTDKSENATTYYWEFGDNSTSSDLKSPTHSYVKEGEYTVTLNIKNTDGCLDTTSYKFIKVSENISLIIPNVFSPNNDKTNDFFTIKSSGVKAFSCIIYNRWGKQVVKLEDVNTLWDGGNYADGVYFYIMNVTFIDDTTKEYNGNVTLLR